MSSDNIPPWHIEAKERGINYIVILYEKADCLVFSPSDLDQPIGMGGDYSGTMPSKRKNVSADFERYFHRAFLGRVEWFVPFLHKINNGVNFSLDDLKLEKRKVRVISGEWPW